MSRARWVHATGLFTAPTFDGEAALAALGFPTGLDTVHRFAPHGVSWARLAPHGRAALHTWPERNVVTVDVYAPRPIPLAAALAPLGWVALPEGDPGPDAATLPTRAPG